ncbi:MAG: hypothetical protein K0R61_1351 [Microvirga sp.]|nr:hypothetical protein [Microvirga sp.]
MGMQMGNNRGVIGGLSFWRRKFRSDLSAGPPAPPLGPIGTPSKTWGSLRQPLSTVFLLNAVRPD